MGKWSQHFATYQQVKKTAITAVFINIMLNPLSGS